MKTLTMDFGTSNTVVTRWNALKEEPEIMALERFAQQLGTNPPLIPSVLYAENAADATVVIGKEVFGGTGMNVLNVALVTRAFLFFAYPTKMSGDKVWVNTDLEAGQSLVDGYSGATALAELSAKTTRPSCKAYSSLWHSAQVSKCAATLCSS